MNLAIQSPASRFRHIQSNTRSLQIKTLQLFSAERYELSLTIEDNAARVVAPLQQFCCHSRSGKDEAFVFEIADSRYGVQFSSLAVAVLLVLGHLSELDPTGTRAMDGRVGQPGWTFRFAGTALSITAFAPCLAPKDPGDTFGLSSCFLLFRHIRPCTTEAIEGALQVGTRAPHAFASFPFKSGASVKAAVRTAA